LGPLVKQQFHFDLGMNIGEQEVALAGWFRQLFLSIANIETKTLLLLYFFAAALALLETLSNLINVLDNYPKIFIKKLLFWLIET